MTDQDPVDNVFDDAHQGVRATVAADSLGKGAEDGVEAGPEVSQRGHDFQTESLDHELKRETFVSLQPVTVGAAILWLLFVPFHVLDLPSGIRTGPILVDVCMVVAALGLYLPLRTGRIRIRWAGQAALLFASANSFAVLVIYWLTKQPVQNFYIGVILIATGGMVLMTRWWVVSSVVALGAWSLVVTRIVEGSDLANLAYVQASALMVAIAAHVGRIRSIGRVHEFRLRDKLRETELQALLAETDSARRELDLRVDVRTRELRLAYDDLRIQVEDTARLEIERRELEGDLHHGQRLESIGQLAAGIAHDFNNLLTVITGNMDLVLQLGGSIDDAQRSCLEDARAAADRAADLTRQLLAYSRKQPVVLTTLSPATALEGMRTMIEQTASENTELDLAIGPVDGFVRAGRGQLEQIVMNLVMNACDSMPNGGQLTVELDEVDECPTSSSGAGCVGSFVRLRVTDTGCGMDEETQEKALEPFFTTKELGEGTGLGLSVVYGIVEQQGGYLVLESAVGSGSTLSVYLPATSAEETSESARPEQDRREPIGEEPALTVLLVEDEAAVRRFTKVLLEELGHRVLIAENGGQALALGASYEGEIDLLLTDVMMPGMVGTELAQKMKLARPAIRVLLVSGYTDPRSVADLDGQVGVAFLQKPFTLMSLGGQIRALMVSAVGSLDGHSSDAG
jgi:signal transduction histidine kinase